MADEPNTSVDKRREARLRRVASSLGLAVRKSRTRNPLRLDYCLYRIEDVEKNCIIAGRFPYTYSLSLDAVEAVLDELLEDKAQKEIRAKLQDDPRVRALPPRDRTEGAGPF